MLTDYRITLQVNAKNFLISIELGGEHRQGKPRSNGTGKGNEMETILSGIFRKPLEEEVVGFT